MKKQFNINKFLKNNSPTLLTVIGSIGVGITAIMAAKDTVKAVKRLEKEHWYYENGKNYYVKNIPMKTRIKVAGPCYIPTIITAASTIFCICGANRLNKNVQKSLTSAYILLDQSYKEYRNSVKEVYGEDGELSIAQNIANKKAEETHPTEQDDDAFFDFYSLQFFNSDLSTVRAAEKTANEILHTQGYISLRDVYSLMGESSTKADDLSGWSIGAGRAYDYDSIKIDIQESFKNDGSKYYILDFVNGPTEDYLYL